VWACPVRITGQFRPTELHLGSNKTRDQTRRVDEQTRVDFLADSTRTDSLTRRVGLEQLVDSPNTSCCIRAARPSLSRKGIRLLWLFPYWTAPGTLTKTEGFGRIVNKLERSQKTSSKVFTAVRFAASHYAKRALAGRRITTSFLNSFIFLCKYIDSIGQEPCHAKIRKRAVAKGAGQCVA
jgi:hypothetical protein